MLVFTSEVTTADCLFVWCLTARQHRKVRDKDCLFIYLFVCLVFNGTSTQDRSIYANYERVKPTQSAKDGQRDTMHNSQYFTQCNIVHNKTLQLQKCNNRLSNRMTYLLKYYVSAFTNTKSDTFLSSV